MNQGRFLLFKHEMGLLLLRGDQVKRNPQNYEASKNKRNLNVEGKAIPFKTEATSYLGQHYYIKK